ncbi:MAG TPA: hypothetical protein VK832_05875, partial [Burkholderiaceae bacterium]|nr:hypothetical protein [Burkholderiaceae bacterium]
RLRRLIGHLAAVGNALAKIFLKIRTRTIDSTARGIAGVAQGIRLRGKSFASFRDFGRNGESVWRRERSQRESQRKKRYPKPGFGGHRQSPLANHTAAFA